VFDRTSPPPHVAAFLHDRHFASLTTVRPDGTLHCALVGFAYDPSTSIAWLILRGSGQKLANLRASAQATANEAVVGAVSRVQSEVVLCQSLGGQWLSLEGSLRLSDDPNDRVEALTRYRQRYGEGVGDDPTRIIAMLTVRKIYGFVLGAEPEVVR
jgi:F420H(2)-dependent biliverdin reductase